MDEVDGRFATASAAHRHVLGYLGLRGGINFPLEHLSAQVPGVNQPLTANLRISFAQLFQMTARQASITACPVNLDKLGTNQSMPLTLAILCSQAAFPTKTQENEEGPHPDTAS